jgi:hypothetical protein
MGRVRRMKMDWTVVAHGATFAWSAEEIELRRVTCPSFDQDILVTAGIAQWAQHGTVLLFGITVLFGAKHTLRGRGGAKQAD